MFESITGWRYVDYSASGWVAARWLLFLPLALLFAGLSAGLMGGVLALLGIIFGGELPKALAYSVSYFVSGYTFMMTGAMLVPRAKRVIAYVLLGISLVCILFAINSALQVMSAFNIDKTYVLYGYVTTLVGNGVAFARLARQNFFTSSASLPTPEPGR